MKFIQTKQDVSGLWQVARKKPITISCIQMDEPFQVSTNDGVMEGKAGDILIEGVQGELYPCAKEIFNKTYDIE